MCTEKSCGQFCLTMKLYTLLKEIKSAKACLTYPTNYPSFTKGKLRAPFIIKSGYRELADITYSTSLYKAQAAWKMGRNKFLYKHFTTQ